MRRLRSRHGAFGGGAVIGVEADFKGIIDIVQMKALIWHDEQLGAKFDYAEIPADMAAKAQEMHLKLVEMAVEEDEKLLEAYLDGKYASAVNQDALQHRKGRSRLT